ncbi:unnamed protein product [Gadus morhua 'NCC']
MERGKKKEKDHQLITLKSSSLLLTLVLGQGRGMWWAPESSWKSLGLTREQETQEPQSPEPETREPENGRQRSEGAPHPRRDTE